MYGLAEVLPDCTFSGLEECHQQSGYGLFFKLGLIFLHQQEISNMLMLNSFNIILPRLVHGYNIFRMVIPDFKQGCKLTVNRGLFHHFVSDLNVNFFFFQFGNKVNLFIIRFSHKYSVSSSFKLKHHNVLQNT